VRRKLVRELSGQWEMADKRQPIVAVIDDDEEVRISTAVLLEAHDYAVRSFSSAEEFLETPFEPDCLVLDFQLPGQSGLELLQTLHGANRAIPCIIVSARSHMLPAVTPAYAVLQKPLSAEPLLALLAELLVTPPAAADGLGKAAL
jgi:FixJ family two-component response regulator